MKPARLSAAIILSLTLATNVQGGELNLVIPVYTAHANYDGYERNDSNPGIGGEYVMGPHEMGAVYVHRDSYEEKTVYLYYSYRFENGLGAGVFYPNYAKESPASASPAPALSYKYGPVRVVTTFPFGKLVDSYGDGQVDMLSVQLIL